MKKIILLICLIPLLNVGCGGDDDTPQPKDNVLDKELILDKRWQNKENTIVHMFKSDGTYGVNDTWEWLNGSDTIRVHQKASNKEFLWIINKGNTENKMEAKLEGGIGWTEYRVTW